MGARRITAALPLAQGVKADQTLRNRERIAKPFTHRATGSTMR
jgi:hypothetical protein